MKKLLLTIVGLFMFFMSLLAQEKAAGGGGNCPGCSCSNVFTSCSVDQCCPPNLPKCQCSAFNAICECKGPGTTGGKIILNTQNVDGLILYLGSKEFSSNASQQLKGLLSDWISYYQNDKMGDFHSTGESIEHLATKLPQTEKQKVNSWIQSKGGTVFIK